LHLSNTEAPLKCPCCGHEKFAPPALCPECGFSGSLSEIEELAHVQYLLDELVGWQDVPSVVRERKSKQYARRQRELQVELELREGEAVAGGTIR